MYIISVPNLGRVANFLLLSDIHPTLFIVLCKKKCLKKKRIQFGTFMEKFAMIYPKSFPKFLIYHFYWVAVNPKKTCITQSKAAIK